MVRRRRNPNYSRKRKSTLSKKIKSEMRKIAYSTQETKHHRVVNELDGSYVAVTRAGVSYELNSVDSQGVASGDFVGQEIRQMGLSVSGIIRQLSNVGAGDIPPGGVVRMLIVQFTQAFQAEISSGSSNLDDMFYATNGDLRLVSPVRESAVEKKYVDKTYILDNLTGENRDTLQFNHFVKLGMKKYKVLEGTEPETTGSDKIHLCLFSDVITEGQSNPDFIFHSTLWYKDA